MVDFYISAIEPYPQTYQMTFYSYLKEQGLLHKLDSPEELPTLRKKYRASYKKMYAKEYAKKRVHRVVIFSQEEYKRLKTACKNHRKPFSTFVRESALAYTFNGYILPNPSETKAVLLALKRYGVNLNQISHLCNYRSKVLSKDVERVQSNFGSLSKDIKRIYTQPIKIEDFVRDVLSKNPQYAPKIQKVLNDLKQ